MRCCLFTLFVCWTSASLAGDFSYRSPGKLVPPESGEGVSSRTIFSPDIKFPLRLKFNQDAFLNSQVWAPGGSRPVGRGGNQADPANFKMPWADNFCEERDRSTILCPNGKGHQGQDIRGPSAQGNKWEIVAVEDGKIEYVSKLPTIFLKGESGRLYRYLHSYPPSIRVRSGDIVKKGETLARLSNYGLKNGKSVPYTTHHLHFELIQNVPVEGKVINTFVPPYTSLVEAYRKEKMIESANEGGILKVDQKREIP